MYLADGQVQIRKVDAVTNTIKVIAGTGAFGPDFTADGALATGPVAALALSSDGGGNLFFADLSRAIVLIRRIDAKTGALSTVAGARIQAPKSSGDNGPALKAGIQVGHAMDFDGDGNLFLFDDGEGRVREVILVGSAIQQPGQTPPSIGGPASIVNSASLNGAVASGAWITIFGQNLSASTRVWGGADFVNGALPTSLDGVSVTIGGRPAYVYFVSPGQVNVLAPADTATGQVAVQLTTSNGTSGAVMVTKNSSSPAFFQFDPQGRKYIAAVAVDGTYLGPVGLYGTALTTRPVRPGETVLLFATGLGSTSPAYPDGKLLTQSYPLPALPSVKIGGQTAAVSYAGLVGPGLYQVNVTIPALANGDAVVVIDLGAGVTSPAGLSYLSVGN